MLIFSMYEDLGFTVKFCGYPWQLLPTLTCIVTNGSGLCTACVRTPLSKFAGPFCPLLSPGDTKSGLIKSSYAIHLVEIHVHFVVSSFRYW